jgi:phospholipase D1/2
MGESVHPSVGTEGDSNEKSYDADDAQKQKNLRNLEKFEEQVEKYKAQQGDGSKDSVAHTTMLNGGKMSDETWEGEPEAEKDNFVQEELYVHGKICIVDDRIAICGSANINDRVSGPFLMGLLLIALAGSCTLTRNRICLLFYLPAVSTWLP